MKAVSDAGPLIALAKLGQLGLLLKLYPDIWIPREVYDEVVTEGLRIGAPDARLVDLLVRESRIHVADIALPSPTPAWSTPLHIGEVAAIALARQQSADIVLMDDACARRAARQAGLRLKGTVGLLLDAFRARHITLEELELIIEGIRSQPSLWISERLCDEALRKARELG